MILKQLLGVFSSTLNADPILLWDLVDVNDVDVLHFCLLFNRDSES